MPITEPTPQEIAAGLRKVMTDFDDAVATELNVYNKLMEVRQHQLTAQREFAASKFGKESAQVKKIEMDLASSKMMTKALDQEIEISKFSFPPFAGTGWRINGNVYDSKGEKAGSKTVALINMETQEKIKGVKPFVTGNNGYYAITLNAEQAKALTNSKLGLAIIIKDQDPSVVARNIVVHMDQVDYLDIKLDD